MFTFRPQEKKTVTREEPLGVRELKDRGTRELREGKYRLAAETYRLLTQAEPQSGQNFLRLGNIYERLGLVEVAVDAYREAMSLFERSAELSKALAVGRLLCALRPGDARLRVLVGQLARRCPTGLDRCTATTPSSPDARANSQAKNGPDAPRHVIVLGPAPAGEQTPAPDYVGALRRAFDAAAASTAGADPDGPDGGRGLNEDMTPSWLDRSTA